MATKQHSLDITWRNIECFSQKSPVSCCIKYTGHAEYPTCRETGNHMSGIGHDIQWIGDNNKYRIGAMLQDRPGDSGDDFSICGDQVIPAHTRFPGNSCCNHCDIRTCSVFIITCPSKTGGIIIDRALLPCVKGFSLGQVTHEIEQNYFIYNVLVG